jgi:glycosyltransferase involved in cell wall biosynthesis
LCYIGALSAGGAERQVVELLRHADRGRVTPMLALAHRTGELLADVPSDVPIHEARGTSGLRITGWNRLQRIRSLTRIIRAERIDVVYDRTYLATLDAAAACRGLAVNRISAAVADPAIQWAMYAKRPHWVWKRYARWAYHAADLVLANSAGLARQLREYWGLSEDRVRVQTNAFDWSRIEERAGMTGPDPRRMTLLTVGRIDRHKGHRDLLLALREVLRESPGLPLVWRIVGTGPEKATLRRLVAEWGLESHVELAGVVTNPYAEYRRANLFCLPSRTEGLPNVLIEALGCGTPVLATDCPSGPAEILDRGAYGRLVPVGDVEALTAALREWLRAPEAWRSRTDQGRMAMRARYDAQRIVRVWEDLVLEVASRHIRR